MTGNICDKNHVLSCWVCLPTIILQLP